MAGEKVMDDYEIAERIRFEIAEDRNKVFQAAKKYGYKKIHTDADMASVKVYIGGGTVYINGNGRDGRQTIFIAPDNAELPTLPVDMFFDAEDGSYICIADYLDESAEPLEAGRYIVLNGGGIVVIKKL